MALLLQRSIAIHHEAREPSRKRAELKHSAFARHARGSIARAAAPRIGQAHRPVRRPSARGRTVPSRRCRATRAPTAHAALPVRDHGRAACLRLDRRNAEVLFRGEHECARTLQVVVQHVERLVTEQRDVRPGQRADLRHLRPVTDHDEAAFRRTRERVDDQVDPLVRHEARRGQVERLLCPGAATGGRRRPADRSRSHRAGRSCGYGAR